MTALSALSTFQCNSVKARNEGLGAHMAPNAEGLSILAHLMRVLFHRLIYEEAVFDLVDEAADFDSLPNVCIEGVNAPLVASQREGGQTVDHDTYLLPTQQEGSVDVFFPTCFDTLRGIDFMTSSQNEHRSNARLCSIVTTKKFMTDYADLDATTTGSGYNPLLQDFTNTKFLLSRVDVHHDHHDH